MIFYHPPAPILRPPMVTRIPPAVARPGGSTLRGVPLPPGFNPGGPIRPRTGILTTSPLPAGFNPGGANIPAYPQGGMNLSSSGVGMQVPALQTMSAV
jgi:hypothetical protein